MTGTSMMLTAAQIRRRAYRSGRSYGSSARTLLFVERVGARPGAAPPAKRRCRR